MPNHWDRLMAEGIIENHTTGIAGNKLLDGFYSISVAGSTNSIKPINNLFNTKIISKLKMINRMSYSTERYLKQTYL